MRPHPFVAVLLLLAVALLWPIRRDLVGRSEPSESPRPKMVEMVEPRVRSFMGSRTLELRGLKIQANETEDEMTLSPVKGTLTESGVETVRFSSAKARRFTTRTFELVEFLGQVRASGEQGRRLDSEKIVYSPRTGRLESPGRATLVTKDATITGDRFETSTQLRSGMVVGHVIVTTDSLPAPATAATTHPASPATPSNPTTSPVPLWPVEGVKPATRSESVAVPGKASHKSQAAASGTTRTAVGPVKRRTPRVSRSKGPPSAKRPRPKSGTAPKSKRRNR
ncbi:MAG: hypothetical protein HY814_10795 [Candidatus Riflebacteria bacterium]|nr:hypothetical protein [Candidatus Riflebacteria bacterium]